MFRKLDADVIGTTAMRLAIADLERRAILHQNVWVIRSLPVAPS